VRREPGRLLQLVQWTSIAAPAPILGSGHFDLPADLAARVLGGVHVDVRTSRLERGDYSLRDLHRPFLAALARPAERDDHGAFHAPLALVDVGGCSGAGQAAKAQLPGQDRPGRVLLVARRKGPFRADRSLWPGYLGSGGQLHVELVGVPRGGGRERNDRERSGNAHGEHRKQPGHGWPPSSETGTENSTATGTERIALPDTR